LLGHSPQSRPEPVLFGTNELEAELLIEPNSALHKRRRIEKQTFVTFGADKIFNPHEQQFSNSVASHGWVHSHTPDLQCGALGLGGYGSNNYSRIDGYPHHPVLNPILYLILPRRGYIERFRCISRLMLTKGFANEQLNRTGVRALCSSYPNAGLSSHCFVIFETEGQTCDPALANLLVYPGNQAPCVGAIGAVLIAKLSTKQVFFCIDAR
jgi:hypothetical protein